MMTIKCVSESHETHEWESVDARGIGGKARRINIHTLLSRSIAARRIVHDIRVAERYIRC